MRKDLIGILIIAGISIYTTIILICLEMSITCRTILLIGQYLMQVGIAFSSFCEKEK